MNMLTEDCCYSKVQWIFSFKIFPRDQSLVFNPFAPGDFAEKRILKLVKWFSGHYRAIKS